LKFQSQRLENFRDDIKELHEILIAIGGEIANPTQDIVQNWGVHVSPGEVCDGPCYRRRLIGEEEIREILLDLRRKLVDILD
jgi:hypothetical protein